MEHYYGRALEGKNVLVTGGLGFIGSNLARYCLSLGAHVTIYDNLHPHSGGNLYNVQDVCKELKTVYRDILDFDQLVEHVVGMDFVFNCAASTSHPFSMREPWLNLDTNSRGVINLLEALRRFNPEAKFVHLGTSTQLGKLQYQPADENHPEFPTDIYSANKSVSEKYVLIYARAHGLKATVVRLPNVFGPRAAIHSSEFAFNNYFVGLSLQKKTITVYRPGTQLRNVLYVDDAVSAMLAAAGAENAIAETFFAVGDEHYSILDIAKLTSEIIGGSIDMVDWPANRKSIEIGDAVISNRKIKEMLNWSPTISLKDGLIKTKSYYSNCLEQYLK